MLHENRQYRFPLTSSTVLFYDLAAWLKLGVFLGASISFQTRVLVLTKRHVGSENEIVGTLVHHMSMLPKDHRSLRLNLCKC